MIHIYIYVCIERPSIHWGPTIHLYHHFYYSYISSCIDCPQIVYIIRLDPKSSEVTERVPTESSKLWIRPIVTCKFHSKGEISGEVKGGQDSTFADQLGNGALCIES